MLTFLGESSSGCLFGFLYAFVTPKLLKRRTRVHLLASLVRLLSERKKSACFLPKKLFSFLVRSFKLCMLDPVDCYIFIPVFLTSA